MIRKLNLFGDYLKHFRYDAHKTPRQICKDLRFDLDEYYKWEGNTLKPTLQDAQKLERYLRVKNNELLRLL